MTVENILDKLIFADESWFSELNIKCIQFIRCNYNIIKNTEEWREGFCSRQVELANEIRRFKAKKDN